MHELPRPNDQAPQPLPGEGDVHGPVRIFLFDAAAPWRDGMKATAVGSGAQLAAFARLEEAMQGIEKAFQKEPKPFDKALLSPGRLQEDGRYQAQQLADLLKEKGMGASDILYSSSLVEVKEMAQADGVGFLDKFDSRAIIDLFSGKSPKPGKK